MIKTKINNKDKINDKNNVKDKIMINIRFKDNGLKIF